MSDPVETMHPKSVVVNYRLPAGTPIKVDGISAVVLSETVVAAIEDRGLQYPRCVDESVQV